MDMIQIGAIAITAALCAVVLRQKTPDIGTALALVACVLLLFCTIPAFQEIRQALEEMADTAGISEVILVPVIKTVGIAIVTKLAAEVCRDAKENGIASFVELAGAAAAILLAIPLLNMVLQLIGGLL